MDLQTFLTNIGAFLNSTVVPFIIAIAFLFFIWNAARYFIIGGANSSDQEKARALALWGVLAFVVILSLWGIVNLLVSGFGLGTQTAPNVDYIQSRGGGGLPSGNLTDCLNPNDPAC